MLVVGHIAIMFVGVLVPLPVVVVVVVVHLPLRVPPPPDADPPAQDREPDAHHEQRGHEVEPRIQLLGHDECREQQRHAAEGEHA